VTSKRAAHPPTSEVAKQLRPESVVAILTKLQRAAEQRGDLKSQLLLAAIVLWLNETSALAAAADRRLTLTRCADCYGQVNLPGEVADLILRVRQVARP